MERLKFNYQNALNFINEIELSSMEPQVALAAKMLEEKTGNGNEFLGWLDFHKNYDKEEFKRVQKSAEKIKNDSEILLVIGIGGSYLGARAAIEFLTHTFYNNLEKEKRATPKIIFVGQNISGTYLTDLLDLLGDKEYSINVISKSGTTTEPALAFRVLKNHMEKKYGKEGARARIFATTDKSRGALKKLVDEEGYESFVIPDDVGGRFSVLTPVGLLPIAVAGIDIEELMLGAQDAAKEFSKEFKENDCYKYAAVRNILNRKGKDVELLVNYEPRLHYVSEWWKQLFGESEGKDGKGIFPAAVDFSTDLHSMGQYIQEGKRFLFETVIHIENVDKDIVIEREKDDLDGLNYLAGKNFAFVNKKAAEGTILAHVDGGVPNLEISIPKATPYHLGYLFYFFMKCCGVSGYLLGVNPFDQPGVEAYKKNMFALLGKSGYEELAKKLNDRLKK
ncbi:MAG: glucose-6-phosphate isomerase [Fusobacteriaceae bacterium]|nr:glucose-6-phosphate isomerase [Fusobacteriaceae bacterium]